MILRHSLQSKAHIKSGRSIILKVFLLYLNLTHDKPVNLDDELSGLFQGAITEQSLILGSIVL